MPKKSKASKQGRNAKHGVGRNNALFDGWSVVHCLTGVFMGWVMPPQIALLLMAAWEPFEIFIISPVVARWGIVFGHETLQNSFSDIISDAIGIIIGAFLLANFIDPPFYLFQW